MYGIAGLGQEQAAIGMLIMLEGIRARIASNARKGKATWLYIDEFHNLASQEFSARYLEKIWKEVRKLGGLCTGATQNLADLLQSKVVETMPVSYTHLLAITVSYGLFSGGGLFEAGDGTWNAATMILQICGYCMPFACAAASVKGAELVVRRCLGLG